MISHLDAEALAHLQRARATGSAIERKPAALRLPDPRARELLASAPDVVATGERRELTWERGAAPP